MDGTQKWLGWPLWLVTAVLILGAVTGSAGPIQVIWLLGLLWITASIARIYLGRWRRGAPGPDRPAADQSGADRIDVDQAGYDPTAQPRGDAQGATPSHGPGTGPGASAG